MACEFKSHLRHQRALVEADAAQVDADEDPQEGERQPDPHRSGLERDRQALALGEQGDPLAVSVLQRIVARDKDPHKRQRAAALLAAIEESGPSAER